MAHWAPLYAVGFIQSAVAPLMSFVSPALSAAGLNKRSCKFMQIAFSLFLLFYIADFLNALSNKANRLQYLPTVDVGSATQLD
jgi:hypothetical protein